MKHFFGHPRDWIEGMEAPCHPGYPIYTQSDLVFMGLIKNICSVERMRQKEERFNEKTCIDTLRLLPGHAGLEEMPYYDTLNTYLPKLSPECLSELRKRMLVSLLRGKQYVNHVEETAGKTEVMNVMEYQYETKDKDEKNHTVRFRWISSLEITK